MKILIVEDNERVALFLKSGLMEAGYTIDHAENGRDGMLFAASEHYDVIIMDRMLPGGVDGLAIIEALRKTGNKTPIMILSALSDVEERIRGLKAGCDDYLVKPFAFAELLARIKTLLRRGPVREADVVRVADLEIDVLRRRVTRQSQRIELTAKEFALLHLLAKRQGEVMSRTQIASMVWDMNFDSDTNVVDVAIRRLRAKIDDPYPLKLIQTVRGMGYLVEEREERA